MQDHQRAMFDSCLSDPASGHGRNPPANRTMCVDRASAIDTNIWKRRPLARQ
jgi:hypothetical protein